jgi:hypothetical protein
MDKIRTECNVHFKTLNMQVSNKTQSRNQTSFAEVSREPKQTTETAMQIVPYVLNRKEIFSFCQ